MIRIPNLYVVYNASRNQAVFFLMTAVIAVAFVVPQSAFLPVFLVACFIGFVVSVYGAVKGFQ